jgi:hypothetical protein
MSDLPKPRWREFLASPHHALLAAATLGAGFLTTEPLYFIAGAAAYVVGWVFVPGLPLFQRFLDRKRETAEKAAETSELAQFNAQRDALIDGFSPARRDRYFALAKICKEIGIGASADDPRVRKIEELMWTFLRLLSMEQSLDQFLESEIRDDVPKRLAAAKEEVERLRAEVAALGEGSARDAKERLLTSREELLETMSKRADRLEQAKSNLALVGSEQERLDQQIKLIRADSVATRNAAALTARIDATVENLEQTNQWLSQMDQFRELTADLPLTAQRAGFGEKTTPPPIPQRGKERT